MYKLDNIDKKIIYELGKNSRTSYNQISKQVRSTKEIIAYRIKQLLNKKIITKFVPIFALSKLNIFSSKIYLRLQGLNKESEKKLYDSLIANPHIVWVAKSVGRWDLLLGMYTKNIIEFSIQKNEILSKFGKYIKDYEVTQIEDALVFNRDYLANKPVIYREHFSFGGKIESNVLTKEEINIIQKIKDNARFQAVDIANELNIDSRTVIRKIKSLQKRKILQGFTVFIDLKKIDVKFHKLCIYLQNYEQSKINALITFLRINPNTIHLIKALGSWELEVEIESYKTSNIYDYISELKNKYPETIKQIELVTITNELKLNFFPEKYK